MKILDRPIGPGHRPYLIAEMSGNHNQSLERALEIVDAAAAYGADAIKLQTYTADTMTLNLRMPGFVIDDPKSLWAGRQLHELYQEAHTPWEWHVPILERAAKLGVHCFSTPFDFSSVDFLESLNVPAYKIASFENTDLPLIRRVAATGKPIIMSTGMATAGEIDEAVRAAREAGCRDLVLLKCTSTYPATAENTNISTIPHMRALFGCEVGLSDHTMGCGVSVAATAVGATVIEKHFTLDKDMEGWDHAISADAAELRHIVTEGRNVVTALGSSRRIVSEAEIEKRKKFRRSLVLARALPAGHALAESDLVAKRPGTGVAPDEIGYVIGRRLHASMPADSVLRWKDLV